MGASGTATVDFGAFPGSNQASIAVAQPAILAGSLTEAWLYPSATADHSADEHQVEPLDVQASIPTAGVGFTITVTVRDNPGGEAMRDPRSASARDGIRVYGQWSVAWVWN